MAEIIEERGTERERQWFPIAAQAKVVNMGLAALSSRALVWAATLGGGAMWGVTIAHPDILRIVGSVCYCVTVLVPVLVRDTRG